jgi:hypothetical protein
VAYRNPQLAALSLDELQALDVITKKLALPAPDGPHNQTQSDAATNAIEVECEAVETAQVPENAPNSVQSRPHYAAREKKNEKLKRIKSEDCPLGFPLHGLRSTRKSL